MPEVQWQCDIVLDSSINKRRLIIRFASVVELRTNFYDKGDEYFYCFNIVLLFDPLCLKELRSIKLSGVSDRQ